MIRCPFCQVPHVNNTLYCSHCGLYMLEDDGRETDPLEETRWIGEPADNPASTLSIQPDLKSLAIRLMIGANREVEMFLNKAIHIGRADPADDVLPEIALTDERVSRRHARILKQGDNVVLEDLHSVNGTFINGERLNPYLPKTLSDGDTLQLGTLLIKVKFQKEPQGA